THSYMKWLYKYPQAAYPYRQLIDVNAKRSRREFEYELLDTGIFERNAYWDVVVEYAKASPEDILIRITATNRGPESATLHLIPTLWFRNTWASCEGATKPELRQTSNERGLGIVCASHADLGTRCLYIEGGAPMLFTNNETNTERLFGKPNAGRYVK